MAATGSEEVVAGSSGSVEAQPTARAMTTVVKISTCLMVTLCWRSTLAFLQPMIRSHQFASGTILELLILGLS